MVLAAGLRQLLLACSGNVLAAEMHSAAALQRLARCTAWSCTNIVQQQVRHLSDTTAAGQAGSAADAAAEAAGTPGSQSSTDTDSSSSSSSSSMVATASGSSSLQDQASPFVNTLITGQGSVDLDAAQIGMYYNFNKALVPEAFQPFHQAFYSPPPSQAAAQGRLPGAAGRVCQHQQQQPDVAPQQPGAGTRPAGRILPQPAPPRPRGSGKSITLVQLVEWARSLGWLVLYVPSAVELTRGGFFYKRADGSYDTIISAQHILKSVGDSHQQQLKSLPIKLQATQQLLQSPAALAVAAAAGSSSSEGSRKGGPAGAVSVADGSKSGGGGRVLWDVISTGLSTDDDGHLAVECCLALVNELAAVSAEVPVLLAVDDYNMLHSRTDYGKTISRTPPGRPAYQFRVPIKVSQLNLARNFRLLQRQDLQQCRVVVANTCSGPMPPPVAVPADPSTAVYHLPRFSEVETAHALFYYNERGVAPAAPSKQQVAAVQALTNGSGAELRRWSVQLTMADMGLL